jgi:choline/glycine/proline betaine transport protein
VKTKINPPVFFISLFMVVVLTLLGTVLAKEAEHLFAEMKNYMLSRLGWLYILSVASFLLFAIFIMFSRYGNIRLGPNDSVPEFANISWFAMLFSAGMGIGLMFYAVAEPVMHYSGVMGENLSDIDKAKQAMRITFFHWGLHAWAIYAIVGMSLAYFAFRYGLPLLPRSALYPLIGKKIYGPIGHAVDIFAVVGTLFGVATSLGLGVKQVASGLNILWGVPDGNMTYVLLIVGITCLAIISVVSGVNKGIKFISDFNIGLALLLMFFVLCVGPTTYIFKTFVQNTGDYFSNIVSMTFELHAYEQKDDWLGGWTLYYWGWWIAWSPFVGMFIARISKGRTLKEFLTGVLFIPAGFTFLWMTVFGNTAIFEIVESNAVELVAAVSDDAAKALFAFFEHLPMTSLLSFLAILLVITFFVTSSDSGSLVVDTLTSGGIEDTPKKQKIFWAALEGGIAIALLASGGLAALQTMTIVSAFPFMIIMALFCIGLYKALKQDYMLNQSIELHTTAVQFQSANTFWKDRLDSLTDYPTLEQVETYLKETVKPALQELQGAMLEKQLEATLEHESDHCVLHIKKNGVEDFSYGIQSRQFKLPGYAEQQAEHEDASDYYRLEAVTLQGGQSYDIYGYTQGQIIADAMTHYEKHLHYLFIANKEDPEAT